MAHKSDSEIIEHTHNTARFFTENRQISWVVLVAVVLWGVYGYLRMPKRKDPDIPVRVAVAVTPWPGVKAEKVEELVTRRVEAKIAENPWARKPGAYDYGIKSVTLDGLSIVFVQLDSRVKLTKAEFDNIDLKLKSITDLPQGAGPIQFNGDFGDTAALMLTVASPKESAVAISIRARDIRNAITAARAQTSGKPLGGRAALVVAFPYSIEPQKFQRHRDLLARYMAERAVVRDIRPIQGSGFIGFDAATDAEDATILSSVREFVRERLHSDEIDPDVWQPMVVRDPQGTETKLTVVAGAKYSYRELDDFTDLIQRTLRPVPQVSKVDRAGVLPQTVYLEYSQERLASYGIQPSRLRELLSVRNITEPGGSLNIEGKNLLIDPSGEFHSAAEIGDVLIPTSTGTPLYLRDVVEIWRSYQSPARYLNFYTTRDDTGAWYRARAITLALQMRAGEQIGEFGDAVNQALAMVRRQLPADLIIERTSDQPRQVEENVHLFMSALYEAIILVVLVSWLGFWEWRSALLMAISIPLTLAMTFGMMSVLGIDVQQVSIAALIIALGLLVDDPVVAGDAIKRDLALGHPPVIAAWLGPTKLAKAIMFATITNVAAYLPFLLLTGDTGEFLYSLPIVMTCSLIASRLVSMTFIPLIGYYLLRPSGKPERSTEDRRNHGFTGAYYRVGIWAIRHRGAAFSGSLLFLVLGGILMTQLKTQFFPEDLQYLSYLDIWLPTDAPLEVTNNTAHEAENVIRAVADEYGKAHPAKDGKPERVLKSITSFVGGGGPRFWFSVSPEIQQLNYAQLIVEVVDKELTPHLIAPLQKALSTKIPGARIDLRQLQTNPVENPIEVRLAAQEDIGTRGEDNQMDTLRSLAGQIKDIFRRIPIAERVRDDWDEKSFVARLQIDSDRANLAGISNLDVAASSSAAMSGMPVNTLREGDKQIPIVARLRLEERAQLSDIQNLYIYSALSPNKVPLRTISSIHYDLETPKIARRDHFRTISVRAFPTAGSLPSEVLKQVQAQLSNFAKKLPPGYTMTIGGEKAKQEEGFGELTIVLLMSIALIFLALVSQFNHAVKPLLVFAAVPYGVVGALAALYIMKTPFGFMAFLGIVSLVGVIVSHVIVLFDFIEEMHEKGEPLIDSLLDAGIERLRPVMITVGATVFALFPLALHGGPLWEPLCYAQIGGLGVATFVELLLVPVLYAIFVLDLKIVRWEAQKPLGVQP
ncbi:MAG: efflux RND transporter permease subunit [Chloroflexota bacterium]